MSQLVCDKCRADNHKACAQKVALLERELAVVREVARERITLLEADVERLTRERNEAKEPKS
jgi:uncharacterized small protein (DUF1192 family)